MNISNTLTILSISNQLFELNKFFFVQFFRFFLRVFFSESNMLILFVYAFLGSVRGTSLPSTSVFLPLVGESGGDVFDSIESLYLSEVSDISPLITFDSQSDVDSVITKYASSSFDSSGLERVSPVTYLCGIRQERIPRHILSGIENKIIGPKNFILFILNLQFLSRPQLAFILFVRCQPKLSNTMFFVPVSILIELIRQPLRHFIWNV